MKAWVVRDSKSGLFIGRDGKLPAPGSADRIDSSRNSAHEWDGPLGSPARNLLQTERHDAPPLSGESGNPMIATQDHTRCLAGARLIDRVGEDLMEVRVLCASAAQVFKRAVAGPRGTANLNAQDLATLRLIVERLDGDARDALAHAKAAAGILRRNN